MSNKDTEVACNEVLPCIFSLRERELELFKAIHGLPDEKNRTGISVSEIAGMVGRDRSTVQRMVQKLVGCRMLEKIQTSIPQGGYQYLYRPEDMLEIEATVEKCGAQWLESFRTMLEK